MVDNVDKVVDKYQKVKNSSGFPVDNFLWITFTGNILWKTSFG